METPQTAPAPAVTVETRLDRLEKALTDLLTEMPHVGKDEAARSLALLKGE
ncbi:MAG TPA: hypothetical protein VJQ82_02660 [Terriglobales bacterium]|nr:hypothetical protein [Terriglobales bacterium]